MAAENGGIAARSLSSGLYRRFRICTGSVALLRFADFGSAACCSLSVTAGGELHPAPRPFFMNCIHFIPLGSVCQEEGGDCLFFFLRTYLARNPGFSFSFLLFFQRKREKNKIRVFASTDFLPCTRYHTGRGQSTAQREDV